jgi:hypothetical protein
MESLERAADMLARRLRDGGTNEERRERPAD